MWREGIEDTVPDADTLAKELEKHRLEEALLCAS